MTVEFVKGYKSEKRRIKDCVEMLMAAHEGTIEIGGWPLFWNTLASALLSEMASAMHVSKGREHEVHKDFCDRIEAIREAMLALTPERFANLDDESIILSKKPRATH